MTSRKFQLFIAFVFFSVFAIAQEQEQEAENKTTNADASVEKSMFNVQTGLLGVWGNHEAKLSRSIALRSELGFSIGLFIRPHRKIGFALKPLIAAEPRWYYNLKKRQKKSKRIDGNSGNFVSVRTIYRPNWFVISKEDISTVDDLQAYLVWGIRRNIGKHFNFETGIGAGYAYEFSKQIGYKENDYSFSLYLNLRIGYRF